MLPLMSDVIQTKWLRILAIIPSAAMIYMDQSILPVALPVIQKEFGASTAALHWTVNAYLLAWTIFVILAGKIGDQLGHRTVYIWGMIFFALFSALCSLSPNIGFLIFARALQGIAGAVMIPAQTALISTSFPPHTRGRATGVVVSIGSIFLVLGPLIGGVLTSWISWRWIFWINLPIALIGILLIFAFLPYQPGKKGKIDWLGFFYFAIFANFITVFFMEGGSWGWTNLQTIACALLAFVFLFLLFKREKIAKHPFLETSLFKRPIFVAINVSIFVTQFILMIYVFRTIYTETILGYSLIGAGFIASTTSFPVLFFAYIGGFLSDKIGPKWPIAIGYFFVVFSFLWLGFFPTPSLGSYLFGLIIFGMGVPLIFTPSYSMAMADLPEKKLGVAFALVSMIRMFAATTGLALIFLFIDGEQRLYIPKLGARAAEILSFSHIHFVLAGLTLCAYIAIHSLQKRKSAHQLPNTPAEGWD